MKDTSELVELLLKDRELTDRIARSEILGLATVKVTMRIKERMAAIQRQVDDIRGFVPGDQGEPVFPKWLGKEITATTALLVGALNDWDRPIEQRDPAARLLQRVLFGTDDAPGEWWDTMTGADMAYAIGYTHSQVPLGIAPKVLRITRGGLHWLRSTKGLELTDRAFYQHIQGSEEWKASARALAHM